MAARAHRFADPDTLDTSPLTHILYSFADTDPTTGHIVLIEDDTKVRLRRAHVCAPAHLHARAQKLFDGDVQEAVSPALARAGKTAHSRSRV